jgi:two-component system nitrate/nitrite response regulator NarL
VRPRLPLRGWALRRYSVDRPGLPAHNLTCSGLRVVFDRVERSSMLVPPTPASAGSFGQREQGARAENGSLSAGSSELIAAARATIRVLVVAEVRLYREGLSTVLARAPDIEIVASAADWTDAARLLRRFDADTVVLDLDVPDPLAAVSGLVRSAPAARVVGVAVGDAEQDIVALAEAGVSGYLTRDEPIDALVAVIDSVSRGELVCSRSVAGALLRRVTAAAPSARSDTDSDIRLTRREHEILVLIERGFSNKQISRELTIEVTTVKNHVHSLLEKLGVGCRGEAAAIARRREAADIEARV